MNCINILKYGIATQKDSPYLRPLSQAILKLQESGILHSLKDKWWKQKRGGGACADDGKMFLNKLMKIRH